MKLFWPIAYADRSVPESTLRTWHLGRGGSSRFADAVECFLVGSKRLTSFNPRTFTRWNWCRRLWRGWFRCRRGRRRGFRCGWFRRRGFRCGWFRRGWFRRGWFRCGWFRRRRGRCRGFWSGWFRCWRGRRASLHDFHKLIGKCIAYHNSYIFILGHTMRN